MKFIDKFSLPFVAKLILILLSINMVFQVLVIAGVIPFDMVWGGRLESREEMLRVLPAGLGVMVFVGIVVALKAAYIRNGISEKILNAFLWLFGLLFILNTLGNIVSTSSLEALIFTPVSLVMAIFIFILSTKRRPLP